MFDSLSAYDCRQRAFNCYRDEAKKIAKYINREAEKGNFNLSWGCPKGTKDGLIKIFEDKGFKITDCRNGYIVIHW